MSDLILRAAKGENVERIPVWLMRQAGRILPEYRAVRKKVKGFRDLVKNPELACEVTLQPVEILGVDAAIIFSDILVVPEAMGLPYQMIEEKGPLFEKTVKTVSDVERIKVASPEIELSYVLEAIKLTKRALNGKVPLIGFAGAPWTIFAYMVEGQGSKTFSKAKRMLYADPALSHSLLQKISESTAAYLNAQIAAGVDMVQIFDSWAGILSPDMYSEFSLKYISSICESVYKKHNGRIPITVFAKDAFFAREKLAAVCCNTIGLDWTMDPVESRKIIGQNKTLQGNLDPCLLYSDKNTIRRETRKMISLFGKTRYIANLGHGVYPDTDPDNVKCFVETVKEFGSFS